MTRRSSAAFLQLATMISAEKPALEEYACSLSVQAYIYGYPLVLMDATRQVSLSRGVQVNRVRTWPRSPPSAKQEMARRWPQGQAGTWFVRPVSNRQCTL